MKYYRARWSVLLHVISWFVLAVCLAAGFGCLYHLLPARLFTGLTSSLSWILPFALVLGCALFTVRGYLVTEKTLFVRRLFWYTAISLDGLRSAQADPDAMRASVRTFGNGGAFSFSGYYWSRRLGVYRAYVTDLKQCVVLRFEKKTVVLSPEDPEDFARALMAIHWPTPMGQGQESEVLGEAVSV